MKNDQVTKLYAGMTDKERAALAYGYLCNGNDGDLERKRIESTMPMQNFVGLPMDYRSALGGIIDLAMFYAYAYWKQVAECLAFLSGVQLLLRNDDPEAYVPIAERFNAAEGRLLAIEQAFDAVCDERVLDREVMRSMAGSRFYEIATPGLTPDVEYLSGMRAMFAGILI